MICFQPFILWKHGSMTSGGTMKLNKSNDQDDAYANEIRIEINDSSSTHNNNFAITLKSKKVDVDELLPMAKQWVIEHKQKTWLEK